MAEQIISPGVFTRENDQSFLPQGVGQIGAAIIGPTVKGPAFIPTVVRSFSEFERRFGPLSSETFVPQTVREYLKEAGSVTVCRVLAGGGYTFTNGTNEPAFLLASGETSTGTTFGTSSITLQELPTGSQTQLTINGIDFIGVLSSSLFNTSATEIYYDVEATSLAITTTNLGAAINASSSQTLVTAVSGNNSLYISGSTIGTAGNITISTSSITGNSQGVFAQLTASDGTYSTQGGTNSSTTGTPVILTAIYPSKHTSTPDLQETTISDNAILSSSFSITLSGSFGAGASQQYSASMNPNSSVGDYLPAQLGYDSNNSKNGAVQYTGTAGYSYINFKSIASQSVAVGNLTGYGLGSGSTLSIATLGTTLTYAGLGTSIASEGYSYASTPWIQSQFLDTNKTTKQLFKFHTIAHDTSCNLDYKISIRNLKNPDDIDGIEQYATFTVVVRGYSDKDKSGQQSILETYNNLNLDPASPNYIARRIGDRYPQYNKSLDKVELLGSYPTISLYIRVEVDEAVANKSTSPSLSPKGFAALINPIPVANLSTTCVFPSSSYEGSQTIAGNYNVNAYLGWKFNDKEPDNENFLKPLPTVEESNVAGAFNVENYDGHTSSSLWSGSLSASIDLLGVTGPKSTQLQFSIPFQGGDDGIKPWLPRFTGAESSLASTYENGTNLYGFDLSTTTAAGYEGYNKALNILSNQDEYDINMLVTPGVIKQYHPSVTNRGIDMCEDRGDCFYVMDLASKESTVNNAVSQVSGLDTNYAAVYYPWVKVLDDSVNRPVLVPPSVIVPGAIAASDVSGEWFAPAGLNRGVLRNVIEARMNLNQAERDTLYNERVNPIATFPNTGVCIWGQKTLQQKPTALDRINVRRLLIAVKKYIASASRYLVFEQNTEDTRARFLSIVNPYLESIQQRQGLYAFRVQMDESNNTPDVVDRNQLVGGIFLQPTRTAEYIILDFNIMPTGATFDSNAGGAGGGGY